MPYHNDLCGRRRVWTRKTKSGHVYIIAVCFVGTLAGHYQILGSAKNPRSDVCGFQYKITIRLEIELYVV